MQRQVSLCVRETGWADKHPEIESYTETKRKADAETGLTDKHREIESQPETER